MLKPILLSACLALPPGVVAAQNDTGGPAPQAQSRDTPQRAPQRPQGGPEGRGGPAMEARHGSGMSKGFVLELGDERSLRVACGDETMSECMEAVRPVIDQMPSLTGGQ